MHSLFFVHQNLKQQHNSSTIKDRQKSKVYNFKMDLEPLKKLNIHFFGAEAHQDGHKACYFVVRPFGNYLIFGLDRLPINPTFIMSKGGVYKQLLTSIEQVTEQGKKFFTTFGCSATLPPHDDHQPYFDPKLRFEIYGEDFSDKDMRYYPIAGGHWIHLYHADRGILFSDEGLLIDNGKWSLKNKALPGELEQLQRLEVDIVLPRLFKGPSPYQVLGPEMYYQKIESLKN